ncbi:MAG TPA: hypothetical protein VFS21_03285 [Roseiflexaceae bacterium]|nr:hypothetical protein [Roseiflexaceae bacterium]
MATHRDSIRSDRNTHQTADVLPPQVLNAEAASVGLPMAAALLVFQFQEASRLAEADDLNADYVAARRAEGCDSGPVFYADYIAAWQAAGRAETAAEAADYCEIAARRTRLFLVYGRERRAALLSSLYPRGLAAAEIAEIVNRAAIEATLAAAEAYAAALV